jgi:hypothetical protein
MLPARLVILFVVTQSHCAAQTAQLRIIPPVQGDGEAYVQAVSGSGRAVLINGGPQSRVWRVGIGYIGLGTGWQAQGISFDGAYCVGSGVFANRTCAARWSVATGLQSLGDHWGLAERVTPDGQFVAITSPGRWSAAGFVGLGAGMPLNPVRMAGISDDGRVITYYGQAPDYRMRSFRWQEGVGSAPIRAGRETQVADMTPDGRVIVGRGCNSWMEPTRAFRWTLADGDWRAPLDISPGPNVSSDITAVSADGWRVIGLVHVQPIPRPFIWDPVNGARFFTSQLAAWGVPNLESWPGVFPVGMSRDGRTVVGNGFTTHEEIVEVTYMWLVTIPAFCYANCDGSTVAPQLNVLDFNCFLNKFTAAVSGDRAASIYANCNNDEAIDVVDFSCFMNKFTAGCP